MAPRRPDSPYHDGGTVPTPEGFGDVLEGGDVCFLAQNEGQRVYSTGLHFCPPGEEDVDE